MAQLGLGKQPSPVKAWYEPEGSAIDSGAYYHESQIPACFRFNVSLVAAYPGTETLCKRKQAARVWERERGPQVTKKGALDTFGVACLLQKSLEHTAKSFSYEFFASKGVFLPNFTL
jgi:hypothetical protein